MKLFEISGWIEHNWVNIKVIAETRELAIDAVTGKFTDKSDIVVETICDDCSKPWVDEAETGARYV